MDKPKNFKSLKGSPFPELQILDPFKFEPSADDKFNYGKIKRQFSYRAEHTVEKGENACYQHFLFFSYEVFKSPISQGDEINDYFVNK